MFRDIARPCRLLSRHSLAFFALLLFPLRASADAGIPMLPFAYPVILVLLIPVIAIEVFYLRARLKTRWPATLFAVAKANVVTMLLGYPLAWVLFLGIELVLWIGLATTGVSDRLQWAPGHAVAKIVIVATSAAWMGPVGERWAIPFAFVILLIPSFILSGFVESRLLERDGWLPCDSPCSRAVWQANALSYVFLAIVGCSTLWRFLGWSKP
jgi:hypothetical protein